MTYSSSTAHAYEVFDNKVFGLRGLHLDGSGSKSQNRRIQIIITKKVAEFSLLDSNRDQLAFFITAKIIKIDFYHQIGLSTEKSVKT